jgi:hypothetical protein
MPTLKGETFYDLAVRSLEAQERQVASLRTRTGTLVAAATVIATVLAQNVFATSRPDAWLPWLATTVGLAGGVLLLLASIYVLRSHDVAFSVGDAATAFEHAVDFGGLEDDDPEGLHTGLTYILSDIHGKNAPTVERLKTAFAVALAGLLAETVGLGLAAALQ